MDQARELLATAAEAACIECMRVKIQLMPEIEANACETNAGIEAQLVAACGDQDAACAGLP